MDDASDDVYRKALNCAIRILTLREHSTAELCQKLRRRGYAKDVIRRVLEDCRRQSYLDDRRAAIQLLDSMKRRGFGVHRVRSELLKRGLHDNECEFDFTEERSIALRMALKKDKSLQRETESSRRRLQLIRFLRSRGFSERALLEALKSLEK